MTRPIHDRAALRPYMVGVVVVVAVLVILVVVLVVAAIVVAVVVAIDLQDLNRFRNDKLRITYRHQDSA